MGVQTAPDTAQPPNSHMQDTNSKVSRHQKRLAFLTALKNCNSMKLAAEAAGVHENTGQRWAKQARGRSGEALADAARRVIATKDEVAEVLTVIGLDDSIEPASRIKALGELNTQRGYHEPVKTHNVNVQITVHSSTLELLRADAAESIAAMRKQQALASGEQRQIGPGEPPIGTAAESVTAPQNISHGEEK